MRLFALAALPLLALAFSGCSGAGNGGLDAYSAMRKEARGWHSDVVGLGVSGLETNDPATGFGDGMALNVTVDAKPGDGRVDAWVGAFYSPDAESLLVVGLDTAGVHRLGEQAVKADLKARAFSAAAVAAYAQVEAGFEVDSSKAVAALRGHNGTLDAAFTAAVNFTVTYSADFDEGIWHIAGQIDGLYFAGKVGLSNGTVLALTVKTHSVLPAVHVQLPDPIHKSGTVTLSADPLNIAGLPICSTPTATCERVPFSIEAAATVTADLKWSHTGEDYDLYIYQDGALVSNVGINNLPPAGVNDLIATSQHMVQPLEAGDYEFVVVAWSAVASSWTLDATFA